MTQNTNTADHIIVGGGIIGLLTAYYLGEAGARVLLVERGEIGQEASWAGGGILSPLYPWRYPEAVTQLVQWSQNHYPLLAERLHAHTGIDAQWTRSGLLILDKEEQDDALYWAEHTRTPLQFVNANELYAIEPALSHAYHSAMWFPDVAQVRNPRLVKALRQYLQQRGVVIMDHTEVTSILTQGQQVQGIGTTQGDIACNSVVIACGAWSAAVTQQLGFSLDVQPVRGQMIVIKTEPGSVQRIVMNDARYVIPRRDGNVLVGSTLEYVDFDKSTTDAAQAALKEVAGQLIPALQDYPVTEHWAGLRPGSSDNIPTIDAHPLIEGLYINAGHYRNGVVMAPASARLMTDLLLGLDSEFNTTLYKAKRHQPTS